MFSLSLDRGRKKIIIIKEQVNVEEKRKETLFVWSKIGKRCRTMSSCKYSKTQRLARLAANQLPPSHSMALMNKERAKT